MADESTWRPAEIVHRFGLERKESQYVVDVALHRARPARTPCPDRGTNVIHDRNTWRAFAHPARDAMGKFGAVDDDQNIRTCRDDGIGGFAYASQDFRKPCRNRDETDDR